MNTIRINLKKDINGFWDGGSRKSFDFTLRRTQTDKQGFFRRVDCWEGNHWFHIGAGKKKEQSNLQCLGTVKSMVKRGYFIKDIKSIESMELINI